MSNALIVVLALVLVAALAALIVILRRQTTAPALDENAIRRLLTESIDASSQREARGQQAVANRTPRRARNHRSRSRAFAGGPARPGSDQAGDGRSRGSGDPQGRRRCRRFGARTFAAATPPGCGPRPRPKRTRRWRRPRPRRRLCTPGSNPNASAWPRKRSTPWPASGPSWSRRSSGCARPRATLADDQQALAAEQERIRVERQELGTSRSAADSRESDLRGQAAELADQGRGAWPSAHRRSMSSSAVQQAELTRISGLTIPAARAELLRPRSRPSAATPPS